jgi:hypothetical protein
MVKANIQGADVVTGRVFLSIVQSQYDRKPGICKMFSRTESNHSVKGGGKLFDHGYGSYGFQLPPFPSRSLRDKGGRAVLGTKPMVKRLTGKSH